MTGIVGVAVSAFVAAGLAVGTIFGVVTTRSATPDPVDKPLVVYGER